MKKLLALVLTVCLVLGLASIAVAEADGPKYAVILKTTNSDFWRGMYDGVAAYAEENGIAVDYAMNTLCAAGTGAFLSSQAHRLGVEVEEFGDIALTSKKPANIAARCTVFAESDLVHKIQVGYAREDIIAGLCRAVATNYLNNVGKGKQIAAPVVFQGGVSKNAGVVRAFEDMLGMDVLVDPDGHLMGAFGVALLAAEAAPRAGEPGGGEAFDFDALRTFEFVTREVECQKCANHCEIICVYRDGKIIDSWGNRCDKGAVKAG